MKSVHIGLAFCFGLVLVAGAPATKNKKEKVVKDNVAESKKVVEQRKGSISGIDLLSVSDAIVRLIPLFESRSVEAAVLMFTDVSIDKVYPVAKELAQNQKLNIARDDLLQFIIGLALFYSGDEVSQRKLLDLIVDNAWLHKGTPILYVAAKSYPKAIKGLASWVAERQKEAEEKLAKPVQSAGPKALKYAVTQNDLAALKTLHNQGVAITKKQATQLVWLAILKKRKVDFIPYLKKQGANLDEVKTRGKLKGYTPLIAAVAGDDLAMTKALIEAKVDVNKIADVEVGSALQKAIEVGRKTKHHDIEFLLRDNGARE